jgi:hypothetical protein
MGLIQDWLRERKEKKAEKSNYERQQKVIEGYEQKKISDEERQLMKHYEAKRQEAIKAKLEQINKAKTKTFWGGHDHNPVDAPNVVSGSENIFKHKDKNNPFLR